MYPCAITVLSPKFLVFSLLHICLCVIRKDPNGCLEFCFRVGLCFIAHDSVRNWTGFAILKLLKYSTASSHSCLLLGFYQVVKWFKVVEI
jgi:hypothetical protein